MTEIIEGTAVEIEPRPEDTIEVQAGWSGETPFYLVIEPVDQEGGNIGIDLDSPWHTTHADKMRIPSTWWLFHKQSGQPVLSVIVQEGDQPYFTKHHVGNLMAGSELIAYGLGKKCADGSMVRLWILPNGIMCGGDDVDEIAGRMLGG